LRELIGVHAVDFGDDRGAARDAQEVEYLQVFHGLRHDAVVGRDDEQGIVDAAHAGEHVAYEALVARHVDEAYGRAAGQRQISEAEVDRNAARFLLRQPVGVHAGQRLHQRGLAVVDVPGGRDDHGCPLTVRGARAAL
jgi:hypothetical protein